MNPRAIQRAIVRMMYDPAFVAAVHGTRPVPGLGEPERVLLRQVDRRAFTTDRFRRARAVQASSTSIRPAPPRSACPRSRFF